mmetsp:Transcript_38010/g.88839  ORF Transcript_38010/g.88839 Transcript_38010/m.88839 type:complete len:253 (-) Transcript_38010:31-789(-)
MTASSADGARAAEFNNNFEHFSGVMVAVAVVAGLIVLYMLRGMWMDFIYERTCGACHVYNWRDYAICGRCCDLCCGCCFPPYHPNFRLEILVERVEKLRTGAGVGMFQPAAEVFVEVKCGQNPKKNTTLAAVDRHQTAEWNEQLELDVTTTNAKIYLEVLDSKRNSLGSHLLDANQVYNLTTDSSKGQMQDAAKEGFDDDTETLGRPSKLYKNNEVAGLLYLVFKSRPFGQPRDLEADDAQPLMDSKGARTR